MSEIVSAEQIEIVEVSIHSERFQDGKKLYVSGIVPDVQAGANSGIELEIYENIYMPYITGRILNHTDKDIYKVDDIILSYRRYYLGENSRFAKWKNTEPPDWYTRHVCKNCGSVGTISIICRKTPHCPLFRNQ